MTWPKGEKAGVAWPYTGRRVSSLVPWGGSEEPETVEVSQDVVYRRGEGYWEGERVGEGAGEGREGGEAGGGEEGGNRRGRRRRRSRRERSRRGSRRERRRS